MKQYRQTKYWNQVAKYYYYSYKNEETLPGCVFGTIVCMLFLKALWLGIPIIWIWYGWYCNDNNNQLDQNLRILELRKAYEALVKEQFNERVEER